MLLIVSSHQACLYIYSIGKADAGRQHTRLNVCQLIHENKQLLYYLFKLTLTCPCCMKWLAKIFFSFVHHRGDNSHLSGSGGTRTRCSLTFSFPRKWTRCHWAFLWMWQPCLHYVFVSDYQSHSWNNGLNCCTLIQLMYHWVWAPIWIFYINDLLLLILWPIDFWKILNNFVTLFHHLVIN